MTAASLKELGLEDKRRELSLDQADRLGRAAGTNMLKRRLEKKKLPWQICHGSTNRTSHRGREQDTRESRKKRPRFSAPAENAGGPPGQPCYLGFNAATVTGCRLVFVGQNIMERGQFVLRRL